MDDMSVADVLYEAVDVLTERGWAQDFTQMPDGRVCVLKAIEIGAHSCALCFRYAAEALAKQVTDNGDHVHLVTWNDDPDRTYEDVVLALKHAAVDAEARS